MTTYHRDGVEPALDPAPDSGEERGRTDDEDTVQCLGIVSCGELRCILHVTLQAPELPEANI